MAFFINLAVKTSHIFTKTPAHILVKVRLCATFTTDSTSRDISLSRIGSSEVGAIFERWLKRFEENSVSEPKESIEHILTHCLGTRTISDVYKLKNQLLSEQKVAEIDALCEKRLRMLPVQYVIGEWPFRSLNLKMSPPVFIPRPETEELIDVVSTEIARETRNVLDLCCGSGAIALSLLQEHENIKATAVDRSKEACLLTEENAKFNLLQDRIRIICGDIKKLEFREKFDLIVSNPPYVFSDDLSHLQPEIKMYEDLGALDGGEDGLNLIKIILEISSRCLCENGKLFLEVEPRHPRLLLHYLIENRSLALAYAETFKDFSGKDRFVKMIKL